LEQQINYLKAEIKQKDEIISKLSGRDKETEKNVESPREYKPVGKVNPTRVLAQMEALDRKNYWEAEIKRRDELIASEGNATDEEILNAQN